MYGEFYPILLWATSEVGDSNGKLLNKLMNEYNDNVRYEDVIDRFGSQTTRNYANDVIFGIPISWNVQTNMIEISTKTRDELLRFCVFAKSNGVEVTDPFISLGVSGDVEFV